MIVLLAALTAVGSAASVDDLLHQGDAQIAPQGDYVESLKRAAALYQQAAELDPKDPRPPLRLARTYSAIGDCLERGPDLPWYQWGEQAAERALALDEHSAEAHYYYAATRGNSLDQLPFWKVSPSMISDIEHHLQRAIDLDPKHAGALHMMGMFLDSVPGPLRLLLSGKKDQAEGYLLRAVAAAPRWSLLRWDLAEFYRKAGKKEQATQQLRALLALENPNDPWEYAHRFRPKAEAALKQTVAQ